MFKCKAHKPKKKRMPGVTLGSRLHQMVDDTNPSKGTANAPMISPEPPAPGFEHQGHWMPEILHSNHPQTMRNYPIISLGQHLASWQTGWNESSRFCSPTLPENSEHPPSFRREGHHQKMGSMGTFLGGSGQSQPPRGSLQTRTQGEPHLNQIAINESQAGSWKAKDPSTMAHLGCFLLPC